MRRTVLTAALLASLAFLGGYRLAAYLRGPLEIDVRCVKPTYFIRQAPRLGPVPAGTLT